MSKIALHLSISLAALAAAIATPVLAETVAITNARILTAGPAGEIAQGTIVLHDGKIASVGAGASAPAGARIIDAKGARAAQWYAGYGAEPLENRPLTLVMPLATFAADLKAKGLL